MTYKRFIRFSGDAQRAMQVATDVVTHNGFQITSRADNTLHFAGLLKTGAGRHRVLTRILDAQITISGDTILAHLEFGLTGRQTMVASAVLSLLCFSFLIAYGVITDWQLAERRDVGIVAAAAVGGVAFLLIIPFERYVVKRHVSFAIARLLRSMAALGSTSA